MVASFVRALHESHHGLELRIISRGVPSSSSLQAASESAPVIIDIDGPLFTDSADILDTDKL